MISVEIILRREDGTVLVRSTFDALGPGGWLAPENCEIIDGNRLLCGYDYAPLVNTVDEHKKQGGR